MYEDIPEWIQNVTQTDEELSLEENLLSKYNFLKGSYLGHEFRIKQLEEQVDLAIAYERERIVQFLEAEGRPASARLIRRSPVK